METKFELTSIDKNTVTYDLGGGALAAESSFYSAGYGDFIAIEHHTMKHFGTRQVPVSGVTVNGQTFTTDTDAVAAINALDIFPDGQKIVASDPRVDGILSVVPATATPTNQLVDRNTLNSSISSMAANKVTYDAAGNPFPTKAALLAATTFYHKGAAYVPTDHDYCSVSADESAPAPFTNGQTRYVFDGAVWAYDMGVNEQPFTADEVAAIESGITAGKVEQYDTALAGGSAKLSIALITVEDVLYSDEEVKVTRPVIGVGNISSPISITPIGGNFSNIGFIESVGADELINTSIIQLNGISSFNYGGAMATYKASITTRSGRIMFIKITKAHYPYSSNVTSTTKVACLTEVKVIQ